MIKKLALWRGGVSEAYRGLPEVWLEEKKSDEDLIERHDLSGVDAASAIESSFDFLNLNEDHFDILSSDRFVVLENINAWGAPDVKKLITFLQKCEASLYIAATHSKDSDAIKVVKDVVDEDFDYVIPTKEEEFARWLREYLAESRVTISMEDAQKIAETAGESREVGVVVAKSLMLSSEGSTVTWKENISKLFTKLGFVSPYKLTGAIAKGDINDALVVLRRLTDGGMASLAILGMLKKRYQSYLTALSCRNHQDYAKVAGGNPYAAKFVYQEANDLGQNRVAKAIILLGQADGELKGGLTGIPPTTSIEMLVIELTSQFRAAKKR